MKNNENENTNKMPRRAKTGKVVERLVEMSNLATKPSSPDDGLVARLAISTNMLHEPDMSAARSSTMVYPRSWGQNSQGIAQQVS